MTYYETLLFAHILLVAIWIGGGVMLLVLGSRLHGARESGALGALFAQSEWLAQRVFIPSSLLVLISGILLVLEGSWGFDRLWVVLGLVGFAATAGTGLFVIKPGSEAIGGAIAAAGGVDEDSERAMRRLFTLQRIDYAVIAAVIADMVLKPSAEDVGALVAIAAIVVVVAATVVRDLRDADVRPAREPV
jgi:uncharacterized membrane protein